MWWPRPVHSVQPGLFHCRSGAGKQDRGGAWSSPVKTLASLILQYSQAEEARREEDRVRRIRSSYMWEEIGREDSPRSSAAAAVIVAFFFFFWVGRRWRWRCGWDHDRLIWRLNSANRSWESNRRDTLESLTLIIMPPPRSRDLRTYMPVSN